MKQLSCVVVTLRLALPVVGFVSARVLAEGEAASWPTAVCAAADAPVDFGLYQTDLRKGLKDQITQQKDLWQTYCHASPRSDQSLAPLFFLTSRIGQQLTAFGAQLFEDLSQNNASAAAASGAHPWQTYERWTQGVAHFIPAVECAMNDAHQVLCTLDEAVFLAAGNEGSAEDKLFFKIYFPLAQGEDQGLRPWILKNAANDASVRGCLQFGTFDWAHTLSTLADLRTRLKSKQYVERIDGLVNNLLSDVSEKSYRDSRTGAERFNALCVCGRSKAVEPDLDTIIRSLGHEKYVEKEVLAKTQKDIRKGRVKIVESPDGSCTL